MRFAAPEWFLLVPLLVLVAWQRPSLGLQRPLRAALALLAILTLSQPEFRLLRAGLDLWVLVDRSDSTGGDTDAALPEWRQLLERGRRSRDDSIRWVDFASDVVPVEANAGGPYTGNRRLSRTDLAVRTALSLRDPDKSARVLVFSDGFSTESLAGLADRLRDESVPLDVRFLPGRDGEDFSVRRISLPPRARTEEPFLIEVEVAGPRDGPRALTILRDGRPLMETKATLVKGRAVHRFSDRLAMSGAHRYEARLDAVGDPWPGNNHAASWIEITGGPRILLVTGYTDDPVAAVLSRQFTVETVTDPGSLRSGMLAGCRAVVINNVASWQMPADFIAALPFFVEVQGGGLLMAGGKRSFGAGGWFGSAVDPILPVSMELKQDVRKLRAAFSIALDRSGSMSAPAGGGTKMDLANEGAARAIELLGFQDSVSVFAVDSEAHETVSMQQIGDPGNQQALMRLTRRIDSGGGGIYVYNALKAAWQSLRGVSAGTRHIILFADAADAEQPEDYVRLLAEITAAGATVSVIALGTDKDSDAAFLKDVAARGKGRIFFTDRAEDIPDVFTAEAVAVARSLFIEDPVAAKPTGQWQELAAAALAWPERLDGYNLSYRRDWASQALVSQDEFLAPLVAWGRRGAGRSGAISFALGGDFSAAARAWPGYGDFLQTFARWLMGEEIPPGLGLRWNTSGTTLTVDLLHEGATWEETFAVTPPRLLIASGERATDRRELTWQRMAPGFHQASAELEEGELVRGAVIAGSHTLPFGPAAVGTDTEWQLDPARRAELLDTALRSGGRELLDLADAWLSPPVREWRDLNRWLLPLLLLGLVAEAFVTRTGWRMPRFSPRPRAARRPQPAAVRIPAARAIREPEAELPPVPPPDTSPPATQPSRRERFARAKKR